MRLFPLLLAPVLLFGQQVTPVTFACTAEDIDALGLSCSIDEPCPVFLELSAVESTGVRLFLAGNLHTERNTLFSILLASEDSGKTWTEPTQRIRSGSLDQIQFVDLQYGFVSGGLIGSLPRDPFFLTTSDGGKTWRDRPVFDEGRIGTVAQFQFDSKTNGLMIFDRTKRPEDGNRWELHETMTGGDTWMPKQFSSKPMTLKQKSITAEERGWRIREDSRSKTLRLEQKAATGGWTQVAAFPIRAGECKPPEPKTPEDPKR